MTEFAKWLLDLSAGLASILGCILVAMILIYCLNWMFEQLLRHVKCTGLLLDYLQNRKAFKTWLIEKRADNPALQPWKENPKTDWLEDFKQVELPVTKRVCPHCLKIFVGAANRGLCKECAKDRRGL